MAARIDSGIDPKFFEEFKQAIATVFELREAMIMTSKQQISVEVNGAASKTLVDLAGNEMKLAEAVKATKVGYDSLEVSLNRVASLKAQYNGSTDTLIGLEKKLAAAEKEKELAVLARSRAETEASKKNLLDKQAELAAAQTLLAERKRQIAEERELNRLIAEEEKQKQANILKTAQLQKENTPLHITNENQTGANAANADGTVVNAEEKAALEQQLAIQNELNAAKSVNVGITARQIEEEEIQIANINMYRGYVKELTAERNAQNLMTAQGTIRAKELNAEIDHYNQLIKQNVDAQQQQKINVGNYPTLKAELAAVRGEMERLVLAGEKDSEAFQQLSARAQQLTTTMAEVNASTKATEATQKNFTNTLSKGFGLIRQLAYILPGIGLAGIFNLIFEGIGKLFEKLTGVDTLLSRIAEHTDNAYQQQATTITVLRDRFDSLGATMEDKKEVAKELNKELENTGIKIHGTVDAEKFFKEKSQDFIDALLLRAKATADLSVITDNYAKIAKQAADPLGKLDFGDKLVNFEMAFAKSGNIDDFRKSLAALNKETADAYLNVDSDKLLKENKKLTDEMLKNLHEATAIDKRGGFTTDKVGKVKADKTPHDYTNEELAAKKELIEETAKLNTSDLNTTIEHNKRIIDNQKVTEQERLEALDAYYVAKSKRDQINNQKELDETNGLLVKIKEIEGKAIGDRTIAENNLLLHKAGILKRQERLVSESNSVQAQNDDEYYALRDKIVEDGMNDNYQSVVNGLKKIDASYQESYNAEKKAIDDKHTAGTISEKKYQEELLTLNRKYAKEILQAQIDNLKDLVVLFPAGSEQAQKLIDKIAELQKKVDEIKSPKPKEGVLGWTAEQIKLFREIATETDIYIEATNKLNDALDAQSKARIDAIQKEIDAIEKRKQTDIDAVTAAAETGVITADEKQRRIAAINAKAQQEEDNRNQKIASEKRRSAERDKAIAIAEIIIKTALGVVNQLNGDIYSAVPRAIAVGVLGAAELAAAIATPIPEFWKGTENAPKGLARLGEKGTELVIPKTGAPWLADKDMIANLQGGEVIKTHTETMEIMKMFGLGMPAARPGQKNQNEELLDELKESREVLKAIRDKRFPAIPAKQSWWDHYYYMHTK